MIAFANEANVKLCVKASFTVLKIKQVFVMNYSSSSLLICLERTQLSLEQSMVVSTYIIPMLPALKL